MQAPFTDFEHCCSQASISHFLESKLKPDTSAFNCVSCISFQDFPVIGGGTPKTQLWLFSQHLTAFSKPEPVSLVSFGCFRCSACCSACCFSSSCRCSQNPVCSTSWTCWVSCPEDWDIALVISCCNIGCVQLAPGDLEHRL